ncbi:T9SS type A sorting domain-containing protein, partial [Flavobacterium sp. GA093]
GTPVLSKTTLTNVCPLVTVNLADAITETLPAGTQLRWFTSSTNTATPLSGTTTVGAGSYYARYFNGTTGLYSAASVAVTVTIVFCEGDCDNDKVLNSIDLDDDNDGIQDINEGIGIDTDEDGIPNTCDLDSDNDGCFDALEGSLPFSVTQLNADGTIKGSIRANGTPIASGVNGQTSLSAYNENVNGCLKPDLKIDIVVDPVEKTKMTFNFRVEVKELNGVDVTVPVKVELDKSNLYNVGFNESLTILDNLAINNPEWIIDNSLTNRISFTYRGNSGVFLGGATNVLGFSIDRINILDETFLQAAVVATGVRETSTVNNTDRESLPMIVRTEGLKKVNLTSAVVNQKTTGVSSVSSITLFPNPVVSEFTVESSSGLKSVRVMNASGVVLLNLGGLSASSQLINVSNLSTGIYIVEITKSDGSTEIKKILKK